LQKSKEQDPVAMGLQGLHAEGSAHCPPLLLSDQMVKHATQHHTKQHTPHNQQNNPQVHTKSF
jgi:hypothetical protein